MIPSMSTVPFKPEPISTRSFRCSDYEWRRILELADGFTRQQGVHYTASDVIRHACAQYVAEQLARIERRR